MDEMKAGVVCPPWNPKHASEPGVEATDCSACGASLVISATSRALVASGQAVPVCGGCMARSTTPDGEVPEMLVLPGQREELMERMGLSAEEVDDLIEYVRSLPMEEAAAKVREYFERQHNN